MYTPSNVPSIEVDSAAVSGSTTASQRNQRAPASKSASVGMKNAKICNRSGGGFGEAAGSRPRYCSWRPRHSSVTCWSSS